MVAVLNKNKKPLNPCHPAKARWLLNKGYATIHKHFPLTIRLKIKIEDINNKEFFIKLDPGAKTTGVAVVSSQGDVVLFANLSHRADAIKQNLEQRKAFRHSRRNRKTRYRRCKFNNKKGHTNNATSNRPKGWLPPSVKSIVDNVVNLCKKLIKLFPITKIYVETVRFDTQLMANPDILGVEYQQGTLLGYEIREYLLYKHGHDCQYCNGASNISTLEIEHILAKNKGGTNSLRNLTIACRSCNEDKSNLYLEEWLNILSKKKDKLSKERVKYVTKFIKNKDKNLGFKDTAKVNSSRNAVLKDLFALGKEVIVSTGGVTKYNRITSNLPKEHYYDALCVKETQEFKYHKGLKCLNIKAQGRGTRSRTLLNKYGFPRAYLPRQKYFFGYMSGDMVKAVVIKGKYVGTYIGTVSCRSAGTFAMYSKKHCKQIDINQKYIKLVQRADGYKYKLVSLA